jgi:hypothetical protein
MLLGGPISRALGKALRKRKTSQRTSKAGANVPALSGGIGEVMRQLAKRTRSQARGGNSKKKRGRSRLDAARLAASVMRGFGGFYG